MLISGKALWSVVCGTNILPSDEVVGEELEAAAAHLKAGLHYYQPFSQGDHDKWQDIIKLKNNQKTFVQRLGKMLNLCSSQSWSLFQLYLQQEYRGSSSELMSALCSYRSESRLLHDIYNFYLTDPMHLLSCRTHLLASAAAKQIHPYQKLFAMYLHDMLDSDHTLGESVISELELLHERLTWHCDQLDQHSFFVMEDRDKPFKQSALDFAATNADLPENAEYQWIAARLALAKHLLATLLVYYASPNRQCPPEAVYTLLTMAQGSGVCGSVVVNVPQQAAITALLHDVDVLHSLLLTLVINVEADTKTHPFCEAPWRDKLDSLISELGSRPGHLPPLLSWSLLQARRTFLEDTPSNGGSSSGSLGGGGGGATVQQYGRMARRALQGGVMAYFQAMLDNQAVKTDQLLADIARSVVYSVVCVSGTHLSNDGLPPAALVVSCLACPLPAHLFWSEEEGGAGLFVPDALAVFPQQPTPLLGLCTALAGAGKESCDKVVELLTDLPSATWCLDDRSLASCCSEVGGAQVITHSPLLLLDGGISLPPHTSGTLLQATPQQEEEGLYLVQWHVPTNAWQVLLTALHALETQVNHGVAVSDWLVGLVEESLKLVCSVVKSAPLHLTSMTHIVDQSLSLLLQLGRVQEPRLSLMRWLLAVAAEVSQHQPDGVWGRLEKCELLPVLPVGQPSVGENVVQYYRPGALRRLVCGSEASSGRYPGLRSYCQMVCTAVRAGITAHSGVRGGLVFVVREVLPALAVHWSYADARERVQVLEAVMEVLHHAMQDAAVEEDLASEISLQLSSRPGGAALRSVLEGGTGLERALDSPPAQWPHAAHAKALARTAHLALSLLHRLVLRYCTGDSNSPQKQRLQELLAGERRPPHAGGEVFAFTAISHQTPLHLALTVAQYVHHHLNSRLPYLALRTLTKLAQELSVPLVACLGSEADVIRELLLSRLDAATEDTRVKVAITRLLTAAVSSQPGLLRAFLSPPDGLMSSLTTQLDTHSGFPEASSVELCSSIAELVCALWSASHAAATAALRTNTTFWTVLMRRLLNTDIATFNPSLLHHCLRLLALEHFVASREHEGRLAAGLASGFTSFMKERFINCNKHLLSPCADGTLTESQLLLVRDWRDLTSVLLAAYTDTLTDDHLRCVCEGALTSLTACFSCPEEPSLRKAAHLIADILLSVSRHAPLATSHSWYWREAGRAVEGLRAGLLQTPAPTQLRFLTALLLAAQAQRGADNKEAMTSYITSGVRVMLEQHCSLACPTSPTSVPGGGSSEFCSSGAVLQTCCSLLHACLLLQGSEAVHHVTSRTHLVPALVHAATVHVKRSASTSFPVLPASSAPHLPPLTVPCTVVRLLTLLAGDEGSPPELTTQGLATSLALSLTNSQPPDHASCLNEVLWCSLQCVSREGASGVEGLVSLAAVHLPSLVDALSTPHLQPDLAWASASVTAALAPHSRLWAALHPPSYTVLVEATAACLHSATQLVRLRGVLTRDVSGRLTPSYVGETKALTAAQAELVNKLLQVILSCLRACRQLGPEPVELLCNPCVDVAAWLPPLLQPSFRRATAPAAAPPNLATLTALLDVCTAHLVKDKSSAARREPSSSTSSPVTALCPSLLTACGEEALLLLLTQAMLSLMNPDTRAREARDLRTWLHEDMNTFFNQWLGRRPTLAAAPSLSVGPHPTSGGGGLDKNFLKLMQHLINLLCHPSF